ncbi:hypothetical protein ACFLZ8_00130 [Planctomycetota bacterium]
MSMSKQMFEILVGKYLDGEITPSEQRILESHLNKEPESEKLLRRLYDLHEGCGDLVSSKLLRQGKRPEEIFEMAWQKSTKKPLKRFKIGGYIKFMGGVAAGLLLGLSLHFALSDTSSTIQSEPAIEVAAVNQAINDIESARPDDSQLIPQIRNNITNNVDLYTFTDEQGNQWLLEGYRQNVVKPAIYRRGL